jgi:hypothetical protein
MGEKHQTDLPTVFTARKSWCMPKTTSNSRQTVWRYAGLTGQLIAGLGIAVYAGYKIDAWLSISFPLFVWMLPLLVLTAIILKIIRESTRRNDK